MSEAGQGLAPEAFSEVLPSFGAPLRGRARRIGLALFAAWVLAFMAPMVLRGNPYVIGYSLILGAALLVVREPVARRLRGSSIPRAVSFLAASAVLCVAEVWIRLPLLSLEFVQGFLVLLGWCAGVYIVASRLRLGMYEIWFVTGLAGWFQEGFFFHQFSFRDDPVSAVQVLAWAVWAYAMLVLIPVSVVPGPAAVSAPSGRLWRYPLAFVIPLATMWVFLSVAIGLERAVR